MTTDSGAPPGAQASAHESSRRPGLVLTAVGVDRPGLVKDLASHLRKHGGNIEETRMSQLGGEFAVIVLVTGSDQALTEIDNSLRQMEGALGVSCFAKRTSKSVAKEEGRVYSFQASGFDRPGIVEAVTSVLAARHINVTSFSSHLENAPLSGTEMFFLDAIVRLPPSGDFEDLMIGLTEACQREDLEFTLSEV